MEKLLIMCEGPNEREIINILLRHNCLKFSEDDLLGLTPYHARQIKTSAEVRTELEMLFILAENLENSYEKVKSKTKPKDFAKKHISIGKRKYDNSTAFYTDYFGDNPQLLIDSIRKYHQHNGSHQKDEHYIDELLK